MAQREIGLAGRAAQPERAKTPVGCLKLLPRIFERSAEIP